jgi:hypothetical protein
MILAWLLLLTGLTISAVAIYYSVVGLTAIFSAAAIPIIIMGSALEIGKLVCASWLKSNWERAPGFMKYYMTTAVVVLMLITSMGIFGFLSKAHNDQNLVSGDVQSKLAIYDEKIKTARENIDADRRQLKQMDEAVDQLMGRSTDEKGADKANAVRKSQQRDRAALAKDIETNQKLIASLNDEAAPIRAENRKVEAEVGPIKYIAAFIYGAAPDSSMLEKAVTWIIILIVIVFDPLAVIMLLASQMTFAWKNENKDEIPLVHNTVPYTETPTADEKLTVTEPAYEPDDGALTKEQIGQIVETAPDPVEPVPCYKCGTELVNAPGIGPFCPNKNCDVFDNTKNVTPTGWMFSKVVPAELTQEEQDAVDDIIPSEQELHEQWLTEQVHNHVLEQHKNNAIEIGLTADNEPPSPNGTMRGFGSEFPVQARKGDMYLRTDCLPSALYKFNGNTWIEVDKNISDSYVYDDAYINHLIEKIDSGEYDPDLLSDAERDHIESKLLNKQKA